VGPIHTSTEPTLITKSYFAPSVTGGTILNVFQHTSNRTKPRDTWICPDCTTNEYPNKTLPTEIIHYKVHWEPSRENEDDLKNQSPALQEAIRAYYANRAEPTPHIPPQPPLARAQQLLTQMQQQGDYYPEHQSRYGIRLGLQYNKLLCIHTNPINPHTDIQPTGRYELILRAVQYRHEGTTEQKELVTVCQPNGHCIYTLTPERTAILYAQYKHTMNTRPRLINKLKPNNFAEELTGCSQDIKMEQVSPRTKR
jgi:hypothetical protein